MFKSLIAVFCLAAFGVTPGAAIAHQSKMVGDDRYRVSVGFIVEPIHTGERNGLDLIIRRAGEREPLPGLEDGLRAEIISPDGDATRELPVRPQYGSPGRYTFDIMLTQPGRYRVRVWGTIHDIEFDEVFDLSEATPLSDLAFP